MAEQPYIAGTRCIRRGVAAAASDEGTGARAGAGEAKDTVDGMEGASVGPVCGRFDIMDNGYLAIQVNTERVRLPRLRASNVIQDVGRGDRESRG